MILRIFLIFCKLEPRDSYKNNSYKRKKCVQTTYHNWACQTSLWADCTGKILVYMLLSASRERNTLITSLHSCVLSRSWRIDITSVCMNAVCVPTLKCACVGDLFCLSAVASLWFMNISINNLVWNNHDSCPE